MEEEPTSTAGMVKAMAKASGGVNIASEYKSIFSSADGKNKKGDIQHSASDMPGALEALKALVAQAKEKAKGKKLEMWNFRSSPHAHMGKTLDDTLAAFLMWARAGSDGDEDEGAGTINVSKAFRRLESYAEWMEDAAEDLMSSPLTYASCKSALAAWCMASSYDKHGRLVWWFDMGRLDTAALKAVPVEDSLRCFVWFAHTAMYDPKAQLNGMSLVEAIGGLGFWTMMTLVPMKLGVKLDKLTIGVLPIRIKLILVLDAPTWMSVLMKIFGVFMSKKMKQRMQVHKKAWHVVEEHHGRECIPAGFASGECNGTLTKDPVLEAYANK